MNISFTFHKLGFLILIASFGFSISSRAGNPKSLFDQSHVNKWHYELKDKSRIPMSAFEMHDGVLKIADAETGYIRTQKRYKNFVLNVDWRWTKTLGNSGVLIHMQQPDSIWPVCYQVQQKANASGDILCMNGLWANECTDTVKFTVPKQLPSNEKPLGEWNNMRIISKDGTLTVYVNGELQNKVTGLTAKEGYIGFQAEGKPLEFKNLTIN